MDKRSDNLKTVKELKAVIVQYSWVLSEYMWKTNGELSDGAAKG